MQENFPQTWLHLAVLESPTEGWLESLVVFALSRSAPIDISSQPALWGGGMRGTDATLMCVGGSDLMNATNEDHASDLLQANLIQILSAIGREWIDLFFLDANATLDEPQARGAVQALLHVQEEGNIRQLGIKATNTEAALAILNRYPTVFEFVLVGRDQIDTFASKAKLVLNCCDSAVTGVEFCLERVAGIEPA